MSQQERVIFTHENTLAPDCTIHRDATTFFPTKAGLQTFLHSPSAFSPKRTMAFMLRSHNGVHCCGTVGDSHSHSQLSTAKCTFTGDSFRNHGAKIVIFTDITINLIKKCSLDFPIVTFATTNNKEQVAFRKSTNFASGNAKLGGASAIQVNLIAFGLHEHCNQSNNYKTCRNMNYILIVALEFVIAFAGVACLIRYYNSKE